MPEDSTETIVANGTILTPRERIERGTVRFAGDRIAAVDRSDAETTNAIDASGQYVLPGIVDVHGDDVERHLAPRPGARVAPSTAVRRTDVAAVSAGVTTKVHAVAFEDVPEDLRSVDVARELCDAVRAVGEAVAGLADHRLHLRCELNDPNGVAAVLEELQRGATLVSLVEHVPGEGQYADSDGRNHPYRTDGASEILDPVPSRGEMSRSEREGRASRIAAAARRAGVPIASHDDADPAAVERASRVGAVISEFPLTLEAALTAARRNMTVVVGAPNVVRGRSLYGNLDARRAIDAGVVDVLSSDFRPRALLEAMFDESGPVSERVAMVTSAPAAAIGLRNRGRIRAGARADLVIVDPEPVPTVSRVFVAGREVYRVDR